MIKKLICLALVLVCVCSVSFATNVPTQAEAYNRILAMKTKYPEGTPWSGRHYYSWNGGTYGGASACMGFAMLLSDAAFGHLPARNIYPTSGNPIEISDLRVGDILRLPGHSTVVLEKHSDYIIIGEGNWEGRVHWGRKITAAQVRRATYYTTRYPEGYVEPAPAKATVDMVIDGKTVSVSDIAGHWAQEHIKACLTSGLLSVSEEGKNVYFKPDEASSRAQIVTALWRAKGSPKVKENCLFPDVTEDWCRDAVTWAASEGIVTGISKTEFAPNAPISREALATIMFRLAGNSEKGADLSSFSDAESVSAFAKAGLSWAVGEGIISGKNGLLAPQGTTTRAELSAMIVRFSIALSRA